jgi:hypothetical protein
MIRLISDRHSMLFKNLPNEEINFMTSLLVEAKVGEWGSCDVLAAL